MLSASMPHAVAFWASTPLSQDSFQSQSPNPTPSKDLLNRLSANCLTPSFPRRLTESLGVQRKMVVILKPISQVSLSLKLLKATYGILSSFTLKIAREGRASSIGTRHPTNSRHWKEKKTNPHPAIWMPPPPKPPLHCNGLLNWRFLEDMTLLSV